MPPKSSADRLWKMRGFGYLAGRLTRMVNDGQLTREEVEEWLEKEGLERLPRASDFGGKPRKFFQEGKTAGLGKER